MMPRPGDNVLCYLGGHTHIVVIDRGISVANLRILLATSFAGYSPSFTIKYQFPSDDLYTLVTVSTDGDLRNLVDVYDQLVYSSARTTAVNLPRIHVFLFPAAPRSILDSANRADAWFIDGLNGVFGDRRRNSLLANLPHFQFRDWTDHPAATASLSGGSEDVRSTPAHEVAVFPPPPPPPMYPLGDSFAGAISPICDRSVVARTINVNPGGVEMQSDPGCSGRKLSQPESIHGAEEEKSNPTDEQSSQPNSPPLEHGSYPTSSAAQLLQPAYYRVPQPLPQPQQLHAVTMPVYVLPLTQQQQLYCRANPNYVYAGEVPIMLQKAGPSSMIDNAASGGVHPHSAANTGGHPALLQMASPIPAIDDNVMVGTHPASQQSVPTAMISNASSTDVPPTSHLETLTSAIDNAPGASIHPTLQQSVSSPMTSNAASTGVPSTSLVIQNASSGTAHPTLQQIVPAPTTQNAASAGVYPTLRRVPASVPATRCTTFAGMQLTLPQVSTTMIHNVANQGYPYENMTYVLPLSQMVPETGGLPYALISEASLPSYPMPVALQPQHGTNGVPPVSSAYPEMGASLQPHYGTNGAPPISAVHPGMTVSSQLCYGSYGTNGAPPVSTVHPEMAAALQPNYGTNGATSVSTAHPEMAAALQPQYGTNGAPSLSAVHPEIAAALQPQHGTNAAPSASAAHREMTMALQPHHGTNGTLSVSTVHPEMASVLQLHYGTNGAPSISAVHPEMSSALQLHYGTNGAPSVSAEMAAALQPNYATNGHSVSAVLPEMSAALHTYYGTNGAPPVSAVHPEMAAALQIHYGTNGAPPVSAVHPEMAAALPPHHGTNGAPASAVHPEMAVALPPHYGTNGAPPVSAVHPEMAAALQPQYGTNGTPVSAVHPEISSGFTVSLLD